MDDDARNQAGFSLRFCVLAADDDLSRAKATTMEMYLVYQLEACSLVIFMESSISRIVDAKGWLPWEGQV
jgi:hypothetical protein